MTFQEEMEQFHQLMDEYRALRPRIFSALTPSEQLAVELTRLWTLERELTDAEWERIDELEAAYARQVAIEEETPSYRQHAARIGNP